MRLLLTLGTTSLIVALAAACGSAGGASMPGHTNGRTPEPGSRSAAGLVGLGASFAAPDTVYYLSSPETGGSWDRIDAARERMWPHSTPLAQGTGTEMRVILGGLIAFPPGTTSTHGFGRAGSMWLASEHPIRDNVPDLMFYSAVEDRAAAERWATHTGHWRHAAADGDFHVWVLSGNQSAMAISPTDCVWGTSEREVRAAADRATGHEPSLASDPAFRNAVGRVDATGAAILGFSRFNLAGESNLSGYGDHTWHEFSDVSREFGFGSMAFTVSGRPGGAVIRGFPIDGVYRPVQPYRPQLLSVPTGDPPVVVDTEDVYRLFPAAEAVIQSLAAADGQATRRDATTELRRALGLTEAQLQSIDHGEQIAWLGDGGSGFGVLAPDPDAAEATLRATGHRGGIILSPDSVHREGSVVWADRSEPDRVQTSGAPALRQVIAASGMPAHVSLMAYVDTSVTAGFSDSPDPHARYQRYLLWTLPRTRGWEWDLFVEPSPG